MSKFLNFDTITADKEQEEVIVLSSQAQQNISSILNILSNEISSLHKEVSQNNNISDIKKFASMIHDIAVKYDVTLLDDYASKILGAVDSFDIVLIQTLLKEFANIEKKLTDFS